MTIVIYIGTSKSSSHFHQMKNSEWGAVAYLAQSKYGRNGEEITINNNSNYITGIAGDTVSAGESTETINKYNTAKGVLASTTANVYGIYDMAGGSWEYVAAGLTSYIDNGTSNTASLVSITGFSEKLVDRYAGTSSKDTINYAEAANIARYGDAIYETSSSGTSTSANAWNYAYSQFLEATTPFLDRGGSYSRGANADILGFSRNGDYSYNGGGGRFPPSMRTRAL